MCFKNLHENGFPIKNILKELKNKFVTSRKRDYIGGFQNPFCSEIGENHKSQVLNQPIFLMNQKSRIILMKKLINTINLDSLI